VTIGNDQWRISGAKENGMASKITARDRRAVAMYYSGDMAAWRRIKLA